MNIKPLTERYLQMMQLSDQTTVHLITSNRQLLYPKPDDTTQVFNPHFQLDKILSSNQAGSFKSPAGLIAYAPINLSSQKWFVIISSLE